MSQNLGSLSFLSRFDPSEFYEIARDLPSTLELNEAIMNSNSNGDDASSMETLDTTASASAAASILDSTFDVAASSSSSTNNNQNVEIIGTHLLVPENSISKMFESNRGIIDATIIDFDSIANMLAPDETLIANNNNQHLNNGKSLARNYEILPAIPAASNLPSFDEFVGPYNFRISIASSDVPVKKSASWTYSSKLNKLYSLPGVACPVEVSVTGGMPPFGSIIRAMPVFAKFEHIQDLITRCENHKKSKEFGSDDFPLQALTHFVRCRHSQANYVLDMSSGRESVCVPFERPTTGSNSTTVLYQFMCYSSCIGGSQKPARVVLTLEHNGEILGRNSFEVKICACPGRDRTTDEKKLAKEKSAMNKTNSSQKQQTTAAKSKPTQANTSGVLVGAQEQQAAPVQNGHVGHEGNKEAKNFGQISIQSISMPKDEHGVDSQQVFTIQVRGRKNYEILKNLNEALEIQSRMYEKLRNNEETGGGGGASGSMSRAISRGRSFIFNNNNNNNAADAKKTNDVVQKIPSNIEEFLQQIDMSAYFNLMSSKGVKNLDALLNATKRKIDNLNISEKDTATLWNAIVELRGRAQESKKRGDELDESSRGAGSKKARVEQEAACMDSVSANNYVKLSKYQIRCSFKK